MTFKKGNIPWNKGKKKEQLKENYKDGWKGHKKGTPTWNKGLTAKDYNDKHRKKIRNWAKSRIGEQAAHWKGGKQIDKDGYIRIKKENKYILEHHLIMEQKLRRKLKSEEIVHHIDFNKKNNNIDNLHLFSNKSEHTKYHQMLKKIVMEELNYASTV